VTQKERTVDLAAELGRALEPLRGGPGNDRLLRQRARLIEWEEQARKQSFGHWLAESRTWLYASLAVAVAVIALVVTRGGHEALPPLLAQRLTEPAARDSAAGNSPNDGAGLAARGEPVELLPEAWVNASSDAQKLAFSDGSEIVVAKGGSARIGGLDRQGLRMTLEDGHIDASITPGTGYRWVVQAGPYRVTVLGTIFSVDWVREAHRLQVEVRRGRVQVESAESGLGDGFTQTNRVLAAGEQLIVQPPEVGLNTTREGREASGANPDLGKAPGNEPEAEPRVAQVESLPGTNGRPREQREPHAGGHAFSGRASASHEDETRVLPNERPAASGVPGAASPASNAPAASPNTASSAALAPLADDWKRFAEGGQYAQAVSSARTIGIPGLLSSTSVSDLMLLADAARLGGSPDLAQQSLLKIRERFPTHANSAVAAFALGRLAFENTHDDRAAVRWFETYLAEQPNGSLAEGARGRLLMACVRIGDRAKTRRVAEDYLKHHPRGRHASVAQSLLAD
jgi:ferric-dicitrate binding protein FerR (iron transport regulator)